MSKTFAPVEPHGSLEPLFDDVWRVIGSVVMMPLMRISRNMVVVRRGGELTLFNAVRLDDAGLAALEALGEVQHVVRMGVHGMDDAFYVDRYGARRWAMPGMDPLDEGQPNAVLGAEGMPFDDAELFSFEQTKAPEGAVLVGNDALLLTCDSVQHWEPMPFASLPARLATKLMGFDKPAQVGPPWRKMMTPDGGSLRPDFDRLVGLPFKHLVGGHGGLLRDDGPEVLGESIVRNFG